MKHALSTAALALLCAAALPAQAQKITPGLWEYASTMKSSDGEIEAAQARMKAQMASMSPEQRKMVENAMAQSGVQMGGAGQATTAKVCITPEMASREDMTPQQDSRCKNVSQSRSGNTMKFKFECTGEHPSTGEGEHTFITDKQTKGKMVITRESKGKPTTMTIENTGRWLGADCGAVKPITMPPAAKK